jgi:hypothetical protein
MFAAQMVATHNAAMDCFRRAGLPSYAVMTEALARCRGKGQQTGRLEHVTVSAGGQTIVGTVCQPPGGKGRREKEE